MLRAFSAATFGLLLGTIIAWLIDRTDLFIFADEKTRWLVRLGLFLAFGYLGMVLAMRSNKEDFSLIIPYVRFKSQSYSENLLVLDTSAILAYAGGSIAVGELIGEFSDEGARFGLPVLCLVDAATAARHCVLEAHV